jgi:hypothetical protein
MSAKAKDGETQAASIAAEDATKILNADFRNIVRKVAQGKPLTVAELARIESRASGNTDATTYAKNKVELGELLGVDRRTLNRWQKMHGAPEALSNGLWPVAPWREFVRTNGLKGAAPVATNEEALKARKLLAEVEERELRIAIKRNEYIPVFKVREEWVGLVAQATSILRAKFENELPPILSGLDATGIQRECRQAIDDVLRCLHES